MKSLAILPTLYVTQEAEYDEADRLRHLDELLDDWLYGRQPSGNTCAFCQSRAQVDEV